MEALVAKAGMTFTGCIDDYPDGIIFPIDKPYRWTSADVIRKAKWAACRHFQKKNLKVGHAGTLDPLATGVLLVCVGKATKLAEELQRHEKQYLAGVAFGATTPSYDREKEVDRVCGLEGVSRESLSDILPSFLGEQEQVAPLFSAKSVDGVRAYELARKAYRQASCSGEDFDHSASELLSRQMINISSIELVSFDPEFRAPAYESERNIHVNSLESCRLANAEILVSCSKGTYIRALARDLGEAIGSGAFLSSLRRTRNGGFKVEEALSIDEMMSLLG